MLRLKSGQEVRRGVEDLPARQARLGPDIDHGLADGPVPLDHAQPAFVGQARRPGVGRTRHGAFADDQVIVLARQGLQIPLLQALDREADVFEHGGRIGGGDGQRLLTRLGRQRLQQLGSAPYSVTKHAAVGLAEWLSVSHAHQNISVVCVCPQGVRTKMAEHMMQSDAARAAGLDGLLEPETVAEDALDCLAQGRFLCMPGGDKGPARHVEKKAADRERWIGGMRRLQAKLLGSKL